MAYRPWLPEELDFIVTMHDHQKPRPRWKDIGRALHRSANACASQYYLEKKRRAEATTVPTIARSPTDCARALESA